jgi:hypothetical protein
MYLLDRRNDGRNVLLPHQQRSSNQVDIGS